jgi:hypothetical protein
MRPLAPLRTPHRNRLDVLAPQHGATAAAAGMTPVVGDGGVSHATFTGGTNGRNAVIGAEPRAQLLFCHAARFASHVISRFEPYLPIVNDEHRQGRRTPDDDKGIAAGALAGEREAAAGQGVVEASGQRAATDDGKFR